MCEDGSEDTPATAKIVVDNTSPEARQRQLQVQVELAFAKATSKLLAFLVAEPEGNMVEAMRDFVEVHEAASQESIDPKGVAIRIPKLDRKDNDENEHINMILRGSLNMVAAMLKKSARLPLKDRPGDDPTEVHQRDYDKALKEIAEGIELQNVRNA